MNRRRRGFSLIECVIAIALIGSSIIAGLELMEAQATQEYDTVNGLRAETILGRELELVRSSTMSTLTSSGYSADARHPEFDVRKTVQAVDANTREVQIHVRWTNSRGTVSTRSVVTFRCEAAP